VIGKVSPNPADRGEFVSEPGEGILVDNTGRQETPHLRTELTHGDCELELEFNVPEHGASALYLMERYIVHLGDHFGVPVEKLTPSSCGGIAVAAPKVNACAAPGTWQKLHIVFRAPRFDKDGKKTAHARFVKVVLNGTVIHENVDVPNADHWVPEERGLHLVGGRRPVAFRNLRLKRLNPGTATMPDGDILQGRWVAITAERDAAQVEQLADVAVVFRGDRATLQLPGAGGKPGEKIELSFTLDTTRTPR